MTEHDGAEQPATADAAADDASDDAGSSRALRRAWFGVAVLAVAMAGLLVGTGFDLGSLFGGDDPPDPLAGLDEIDWSTGVVVAGDEHDGVGADMVLAVGGDDARCVGIRTDLGDEPAPVRCGLDGFINRWDDPQAQATVMSDHFGFLDEVVVADGDGTWTNVLAGAVSPQVVRVTAHLGDGGEYSFVTRNDGGWFVAVLPASITDPDVETGELLNGPVELDLYDDEGNRITVIDLTRPPEFL
ncbi:MAG: hypothetical protein RIB65_01800 [Ilumatobacter fluminis]|uniref:hypothetical protein n=1 Tax=Ilumatobacter fluminis TaxID=467091 RepID=UPI0032EEEF86